VTRCVVVDIGSTWTKGGLFEVDEDASSEGPGLVNLSRVPTTLDDLGRGFFQLLWQLQGDKEFEGPVYASSSAKGGLRVTALGIVPDLTLKMARQTALSAGARITKVYAYELTDRDLEQIDQDPPDILLFAGGTDGGNKSILEHNTLAIKKLKSRPNVLFAGNRALEAFVAFHLGHFPLTMTENILPELDRPNPEPARKALRAIFLDRLIQGKGLAPVQARCSGPILPTPMRVFDFLRILEEQQLDGWQHLCLVDLGGATTDVYSMGGEQPSEAGVVLSKGVPDEHLSRTVEGDLGMRHSSRGVVDSRRRWVEERLRKTGNNQEWANFEEYVQTVEVEYSSLPNSPAEERYEALLASAAVTGALERHAGRGDSIYTPQGAVQIQRGKDLRPQRKLILSGGYFTSDRGRPQLDLSTSPIDDEGKFVLLPETWETYTDTRTLVPLFANLAVSFPGPAVWGLVASLQKEQL